MKLTDFECQTAFFSNYFVAFEDFLS